MNLKISLFLMLMLATPQYQRWPTQLRMAILAPLLRRMFSQRPVATSLATLWVQCGADDDRIQMCDVTLNHCSALKFDNQTTAVETSFNFGSVNAGDILIFNLDNLTNGFTLSFAPG